MYLRDDEGFGHATGGGATSGGGIVLPASLSLSGFGRTADTTRRGRWAAAIPDFELAVDLGEEIGSFRWFRGLATLGAMLATTWHFAPGLAPLPDVVPAATVLAEQDQVRAIGIAPLALGGDTGMRNAPTDRATPLTSAPERPEIDLVATMGMGDGFIRLLEREGVSDDDAEIAARLIGSAIPIDGIAAGTRIAITLGHRNSARESRPLERLSFRGRIDLSLAVRRVDARLMLDRLPIAVDDTPLRISGSVGESLYHAARSAGVPANLVAEYLRAVDPHLDVEQIAAGDGFDLVMEHRRAVTGDVQFGRLLYAGLTHAGQRLQLLRWTLAGKEQWFDAAGVGEVHSGFSMPVTGARLSSGFGMRFHPILGFSRMHQGVDLAAPYGTPIVAASDGVVSFAGWHGGHGNFVQIAHAGGMGTGYGHMSSFVVRPGDAVQQGQLIGYVGSTGLSTGPHCHFEVYQNGVPIDPATANFQVASQISGTELARFRATLARYTAIAPGGGAVQIAANPKG